ncbi:SDR family NAD(P)-dependent oxidoreductase [Bacteroidota bacterium]
MKTTEIITSQQIQYKSKNPLTLIRNLDMLKGGPKNISMGYAMGVLIGTTPFFGIKIFLAIIIASIFKWNKMAASIGVLIINPLTGPVFHGIAYILGKNLLGLDSGIALQFNYSMEYFKSLVLHGNEIMLALLLGGFILGVPLAFIAYKVSFQLLRHQIEKKLSDDKRKKNEVFTLITGASTGLGKQLAVECAKRGMNLILVALPGRNLDALCKHLEETFGIRTAFYETNLTKKTTIQQMVNQIKRKYAVDMLINNAGIGGSNCFEDSSPEFIENVIMVNIRALSMLTRLLIPELKKHRKAYILNVASMAAFCPMPYKSIYPASKAFVYSFSRSLREELKGSGIKVSVVNPGPILTNPDVVIRILKQGILGRMSLLSASRISNIALNSMIKGKGVIIPGLFNKFNLFLIRILPHQIRMMILTSVFRKDLKSKQLKMAS